MSTLKYNDILNAVTRKLDDIFKNIDIVTTEVKQGFEDSCFFVSIIPLNNEVETKDLREKDITIDIQFLTDSNRNSIYPILDKLEDNFTLGIEVNDRFLTFNDASSNIIKDSVGYILHYLIKINYYDEIIKEKEEYEFIQEINLALKGGK